MPVTSRVRDAWVRAALLATLMSACGRSSSTAKCADRTPCASGEVCVTGQCLPRSNGRVLAFEIDPPSTSVLAATELVGVMMEGDPLVLPADDQATVTGVVSSQVTVFKSEAHVSVALGSRIPGREDLLGGTEMANNQFSFTVAAGRFNAASPASFKFIPGAAAQTQPPISLSVPLASTVNLRFPDSTEMLQVRGRLVDGVGNPVTGAAFSARVSFNTVQISNVRVPETDGEFTLLVPPGSTPVAPDDGVTLTIGSNDGTSTAPTLVVGPTSLATISTDAKSQSDPVVYTMPPYPPTVVSTSVRVLAGGKGSKGVTVRFRTEIPAPPNGLAFYERSGTTDADGNVALSLLPGTAEAPLLYQVSIEAPADSTFGFASQCHIDVPVAIDGPAVGPFTLSPKVTISGTVKSSTSTPVASARVAVTRIAGAVDCLNSVHPNAIMTTTDANGRYTLMVEPGSYRVDVEPSASSPWPRLTEDADLAVLVLQDTVHSIALPVGEVVEGTVTASDQSTPMPGASVTVFDVSCRSVPCEGTMSASVLAKGITDMNGTFRLVVAKATP